jgi:hypothetical protein
MRLSALLDFEGFLEKYLSEEDLIHIASEQDYLFMLYDNWDHRMEGAVMFLAARVNKPVIVYKKIRVDAWFRLLVTVCLPRPIKASLVIL